MDKWAPSQNAPVCSDSQFGPPCSCASVLQRARSVQSLFFLPIHTIYKLYFHCYNVLAGPWYPSNTSRGNRHAEKSKEPFMGVIDPSNLSFDGTYEPITYKACMVLSRNYPFLIHPTNDLYQDGLDFFMAEYYYYCRSTHSLLDLVSCSFFAQ